MASRFWFASILSVLFLVTSTQSHAQKTKQELNEKMAQTLCPAFEKAVSEQKKQTLTREEYYKIVTQTFAPVAGKEMANIKRLYGDDAFGNNQVMNRIGSEVGAQLLQDCPAFITLAQMMVITPTSEAATTGQSVGKLGLLQGTALARLQVQTAKEENTEFLWLTRFPEADDLLTRLSTLQGRQVRVSWQEIDIYQPQEKRYSKMREITGIELL